MTPRPASVNAANQLDTYVGDVISRGLRGHETSNFHRPVTFPASPVSGFGNSSVFVGNVMGPSGAPTYQRFFTRAFVRSLAAADNDMLRLSLAFPVTATVYDWVLTVEDASGVVTTAAQDDTHISLGPMPAANTPAGLLGVVEFYVLGHPFLTGGATLGGADVPKLVTWEGITWDGAGAVFKTFHGRGAYRNGADGAGSGATLWTSSGSDFFAGTCMNYWNIGF